MGREWLFTIKAFAAAMIALGIGFAADLDRPYWAMASAYIAAQPQAGATRSKAVYRLLGTVLGACGAVTLVPNLVDAPALLVTALSGWVALMLMLALLDRTPRSYVFMLAGYTAAIIGFPSVDAPDGVFLTAVARTEEICLGVVCATFVSSLVFPDHAAVQVVARMERWLGVIRGLAQQRLREGTLSHDGRSERLRLAADVIDIGVLTTQLPFDVSGRPASLPAIRALHSRLLMMSAVISSLAARLQALRAHGGVNAEMAREIEDAEAFLRGEVQADRFDHWVEGVAPEATDWRSVLEASLRLRLHELATLIQDCEALLRYLREGLPGLPKLLGGTEIEVATLQHSDLPMAFYSGLSAGLTVALVCCFWIAAAWPEGAVAAEMSAVACCFFAALDDPAPAIQRFTWATLAALIIDGIYLFGVLPAIDGFVMLVVALAPAFLTFGLLVARPSTTGIGMALAVNGATLLALQSAYAADFASFANSGVAAVVGMSAAAVVTRLVRSVGADWSAWRLVRANWISLADAALRRGRGDRAAFWGLIIDRIGLVASRSNTITKELAPDMDKLQADLRIGLNIVALRRARNDASPEVAEAINNVLHGLAGYYRRLAHGPLGRPKRGPDPSGLDRIDEAIFKVILIAKSACRNDALQGLVGVRLALYPDAPPYGASEPPTPIPQRAVA